MPNANGAGANAKDLSGVTAVRTHETVLFRVESIDSIIAEIRRLGQTGSLTLHARNGRIEGVAEFRRETTPREKSKVAP